MTCMFEQYVAFAFLIFKLYIVHRSIVLFSHTTFEDFVPFGGIICMTMYIGVQGSAHVM
jgi:hypothetical protein